MARSREGEPVTQPRLALGLGLVLAGVVFLLDALAVLDLWGAPGGWWPTLLVVGGVVLLLRRGTAIGPARSNSILAVLGVRLAEAEDRPYRGGRVTAVLGHAELDLRDTTLDDEGADLAVRAVLGDVAITVPPGWRVRVEPRLLLAGLDRELLPAPDQAPVLRITGVVLLADLHVRSGSVVT